jgi:hypothetical protein
MIPNSSIDRLAEDIRQRGPTSDPATGLEPYILFLGEGCAKAAGAPSRADLARQALRTFKYEEVDEFVPDEIIFDKFAQHTSDLTPEQLGRMLRSLHAQVPVPLFYQYVAQLIRERYFPLIMTMSFDTLLEQALASSGVRVTDYQVTTFGTRRISSAYPKRSNADQLTHIVKLHGDLAQDVFQITPQQIETTLNLSRQWIKSDLKGDLIMVEHILSDDPIDAWLGHSPSREIWWVSELPPADKTKVQSWSVEPIYEINGSMGAPQTFFEQLALRLLYSSKAEPSEAVDTEVESSSVSIEQTQSGTANTMPPVAEPIFNDILRNQSILFNLDQETVGGERPPQVQRQIEYQKLYISRLEDQVRSLPDVQSQVKDCVQRISEQIRNQGEKVLDAETVEHLALFIDSNYQTLQTELTKDTPNQILVSAALSATLTVADRLLTEHGTSIIDPDNIKRLAALAPTAAAKVVL